MIRIIKFIHCHFYSEDRIRNGVKRILKSRQGATQGRLDTFFKPIATVTAGVKRKVRMLYVTMYVINCFKLNVVLKTPVNEFHMLCYK